MHAKEERLSIPDLFHGSDIERNATIATKNKHGGNNSRICRADDNNERVFQHANLTHQRKSSVSMPEMAQKDERCVKRGAQY